MAERPQILICSCEDTMPLDTEAVRRGCRGSVSTAQHLCRAEIDRFRAAAAEGNPLIVGCTQEAPLFSEVAAERQNPPPITFVNVRETAGWSSDAAKAGPKMAALIAAAAEPVPPRPVVQIASCIGVEPLLFFSRGSAPFLMSALAASMQRFLTARCRGATPLLSIVLGSAPAPIR